MRLVTNIGGILINTVGTTSIDDGRWHHLTGTNNATSISIYVDGIIEAENASVDPQWTSTMYAYMGAARPEKPEGALGPFGRYKGITDEVRIWNRVLSADEIRKMYDSEKASH